jgi:hypothetical protein
MLSLCILELGIDKGKAFEFLLSYGPKDRRLGWSQNWIFACEVLIKVVDVSAIFL